MLECKIKKKFNNFNLDVDFTMDEDHLGLLGPSGSGKSVTLKCIAGIIKPDSGKIVLDDKILFDYTNNIDLRPQDRNVGYLFQDYALFPNFTVEKNVRLGLRDNTNIDISKDLKEMHIFHIKDKYPHQISGGEKQRTALCRILVNRPDILLLDEPFAALDSYMKSSLEDELTRIIKDSKLRTILVSHNKDEVYRICDSIISISGGKTYVKKEKNEFFSNPQTLTEAKLIGITNFSKVEKINANTNYASNWGLNFKSEKGSENKILGLPDKAFFISNAPLGQNSFLIDNYTLIENIDSFTLIYNQDKNKYYDLKIRVLKDDYYRLKDDKIYANIDEDSLVFVEDRW